MIHTDDGRAPLQPDGPLRGAHGGSRQTPLGHPARPYELARPELSNATVSGEHARYSVSRREACEGCEWGSVWVALALGEV